MVQMPQPNSESEQFEIQRREYVSLNLDPAATYVEKIFQTLGLEANDLHIEAAGELLVNFSLGRGIANVIIGAAQVMPMSLRLSKKIDSAEVPTFILFKDQQDGYIFQIDSTFLHAISSGSADLEINGVTYDNAEDLFFFQGIEIAVYLHNILIGESIKNVVDVNDEINYLRQPHKRHALVIKCTAAERFLPQYSERLEMLYNKVINS